jgi:hypothetical protein
MLLCSLFLEQRSCWREWILAVGCLTEGASWGSDEPKPKRWTILNFSLQHFSVSSLSTRRFTDDSLATCNKNSEIVFLFSPDESDILGIVKMILWRKWSSPKKHLTCGGRSYHMQALPKELFYIVLVVLLATASGLCLNLAVYICNEFWASDSSY